MAASRQRAAFLLRAGVLPTQQDHQLPEIPGVMTERGARLFLLGLTPPSEPPGCEAELGERWGFFRPLPLPRQIPRASPARSQGSS